MKIIKATSIIILLIVSNLIVAQDNLHSIIQKVIPKHPGWCQLPTFAPEPSYYLEKDGTFKMNDPMTSTIGQGKYSIIGRDTILLEFDQCNYQDSKISISEVAPSFEGVKITITHHRQPAYGAKLIIKRDSLNLIDTIDVGFDNLYSLKHLNLNNPFSIKVIYDSNLYEIINIDMPFWEPTSQLDIQLGFKKGMMPKKIIAGERLYFTFNENEKLGYTFYNYNTKEIGTLKCNKNFKLLRKSIH